MMKKLSLLLCLLLTLCACALADEEAKTIRCGSYGYCLLPDGTVKITEIYGTSFEDMRMCKTLDDTALPAELDGYPVSALGYGVFHNAIHLTTLELPDSIVTIDGNPFTNCTGLTELIVSPDHPALYTVDGVLFTREDSRLVCYPLGRTATHYDVPQGTQVIAQDAFYNAETLLSVTLPEGLRAIEKGGFSSCDALESVIFGEGLEVIGEEAFFYDGSIREIVLPDTVHTIGKSAFSSCRSLASLTLPAGLKTLENRAFSSCYALGSVVIPEGTEWIGSMAFVEDTALKRAVVPASVTYIFRDAFSKCPVTLVVQEGSYAQNWAESQGVKYVVE